MNRLTTLIILSFSGIAASTAASTAVYAAAASLEAVGVEIRDSDFPGATFELVHRAAPGYALIAQAEHRDFDITLELAGVVDSEAPAQAQALSRAFVGIAFRVQAESDEFEKLYLRLDNGRAEDQLQRNHATQFESLPEHPWHRLRKEAPGKYESYVDVALAQWTRVRIEVRGNRARLFVADAPQPVLVINDELLEARAGGIGLWVGLATIGYFRNIEIEPR